MGIFIWSKMFLLESLLKQENNFFHQKLWSAFSLSFFKIRSPKKWSKRPFLSLPFEGFHGILALLSAHREGIMLRQNN